MALDAVVYPQNNFGYGLKELFMLSGSSGLGYDEFDFLDEPPKSFVEMLENNMMAQGLNNTWESSSCSLLQNVNEWDHNNLSPEACTDQRWFVEGSNNVDAEAEAPVTASTTRRKRRRTKSSKNKEELENQRMTHITVERNRRKQMNDYLAVIRSLMPPSYVQRGDQASIVAGAINFVKELEQQVQSLEAQKRGIEAPNDRKEPPLFSDYFTFPQYSNNNTTTTSDNEMAGQHRSALGDIEVTVVESHANLKILTKKRQRQLLKIVAGLQCLRLTILHVNVTTVDHMVLYSVSVKVEDGCHITTVDEIADAVNNLLGRIEEEETSKTEIQTLVNTLG